MQSGPEPPLSPPDGWAAHDLRVAVEGGLARGARLLTAGELSVARRILALRGPQATVYARLVGRKPLAFPLDSLTVPEPLDAGTLEEALVALQAHGLVDRLVPWTWRAELATRDRLVAGCRRLGLRRSGRRAELEARVRPHTGWDPTPWVRPRHRALVRRLQRFATLRAWPREHDVVLERLGQVAYVDHPITTGPGLFADRAALLGWESVHAALSAEALSAEEALPALDLPRAPAGLDLMGVIRGVVAEEAQRLERTDPERALSLYDALVHRGARASVHFRRARCLEALGRADEALEGLLGARTSVGPVGRRALARSGRRIARSLRRGFPPERPLRSPRIRTLTLPRTGADARPVWTHQRLTVEDAVLAWLSAHGREGVHAEGRLWRSLFALLLADAFFADVPGALPVPRLAAPLDLGTAAFRARRPLVDARLEQIAAGEAPQLLQDALGRYHGRRVAGLHPEISEAWLRRAVTEFPAGALASLIEVLLTERSGGLPDLFLGEGPVAALPAHPSRLLDKALLVEVKGPGDTLSDAQRVWLDRLQGWDVPVEVWEVRAAPP